MDAAQKVIRKANLSFQLFIHVSSNLFFQSRMAHLCSSEISSGFSLRESLSVLMRLTLCRFERLDFKVELLVSNSLKIFRHSSERHFRLVISYTASSSDSFSYSDDIYSTRSAARTWFFSPYTRRFYVSMQPV